MITISLCMIVKNEEKVISRCLKSIQDLVDEIVIVDTGSTDRTKEMVKPFNAKLYDFEWIDDFSAARNYSFSKATMDYILWLDADDVILNEDREKFKMLKKILDPSIDVVTMMYNLAVDKQGKPTVSFCRERLVKRSRNFKWINPVHEYLGYDGKVLNTDIGITHKSVKEALTERNLRILERIIQEGRELSPRNLFYYARELFFHGRVDEAIVQYQKFLDTDGGLEFTYADACLDLSTCYKQKNESKEELRALIRSFEYGIPRADVCCRLGYYFKEKQDYQNAIYWFKAATQLEKPQTIGIVIHDYWGFIPHFELGVCYFHLGDIEEAIKYNREAAKFKSQHHAVINNEKFFREIQVKKEVSR